MAGREDAEAGEPALIQLPACRIVTVRELCEQVGALANAQVRFVARLESIDCVQGSATFEDNGARVVVDTSLLAVSQQPSRVGGLYSVMGEVEVDDATGAEALRVRARIVRAVEGLDTSLWEQALAIRRQYDARVASA